MSQQAKKPPINPVVLERAKENDWQVIDYQDAIQMVSFARIYDKQKQRLNIYMTTGTVATALNHPIQGKTQLYRKGLTVIQILKLFEDPRLHTNNGYQKKRRARG